MTLNYRNSIFFLVGLVISVVWAIVYTNIEAYNYFSKYYVNTVFPAGNKKGVVLNIATVQNVIVSLYQLILLIVGLLILTKKLKKIYIVIAIALLILTWIPFYQYFFADSVLDINFK